MVIVCVRARKCAFYGCELYKKFKEYRESIRKTGGLKPVFEHAQKVRERSQSFRNNLRGNRYELVTKRLAAVDEK